ncbi:MAG: TIGR00282 family metallophosphoesterase [Proteobacteria bacterium]|nr:TIGR00282 family metallophosphoesterase [Pseudomonadota bacterium]
MKILFLGDIVGRPGRTAVKERLGRLREEHGLDMVVANGENASGGLGLSSKVARELLGAGIDVLTSGNHIWKFREVYNFLTTEPRLLRPDNFPQGVPGRGFGVFEMDSVRVAVVNLQGRTFMQPVDCPFKAADRILADLKGRAEVILVDFHAEATSEKTAMAWHLEGRVSVLVGTHTHIQTSDARVLPGGTGYITDLGMCGPVDSCLGMKSQPILDRFLSGLPTRFEVAGGRVAIQGVVAEVDETTGRARSMELLDLS